MPHTLRFQFHNHGAQAQELAYTQPHLTQDSLVCRLRQDDIRKLLANHTSENTVEKHIVASICALADTVLCEDKIATSEQIGGILHCENV